MKVDVFFKGIVIIVVDGVIFGLLFEGVIDVVVEKVCFEKLFGKFVKEFGGLCGCLNNFKFVVLVLEEVVIEVKVNLQVCEEEEVKFKDVFSCFVEFD